MRADAPSRRVWRWVVVGAGAVVCLVWIAQAPRRPALGIFGLLLLAAIVLAANVGRLRDRVPLLRSHDPNRAIAGWSLIGVVMLVSAFSALGGSILPGGAGVRTSFATPPAGPAATGSLASDSPTDTPTPFPTPTPTPTPTATPTPAPTPAPTPTLRPGLTLDGPITVQRGNQATLTGQTSPRTSCTMTVTYLGAPPPLTSTSNGAGAVSWSWQVASTAPRGTFPITARCGISTASTTITITR